MIHYKRLTEDISISLNKGDTFLYGKWKNKRAIYDHIEQNEKGEDVIVTDTGKIIPLLKIRLIKEAVINTDRYSNILEKITNNIWNDISGKNLNRISMQWYLNKLFKSFRILFKIIKQDQIKKDEFYRVGLIQAETLLNKYSTIIITCSMNIFDITKNERICETFIKYLLRLIKHELIHRLQVIEIANDRIKKQLATNKKDKFEYFSNKQELMAYAWEILEELRFSGLTDNQIEQKLKKLDFTSMHSGILFSYVKLFNDNFEVLKQLYKYIYMYIHEQYSDKELR